MKPELPPMNREALEAKVTALLLGELPEGEAALLRELIARDAGLAKFHAQLGLTLGLLRETVATPEPAPSAPMKLSEERREKLLAHFKTVAPKEFAKAPRRRNSWLVPLATAAVFVLLAKVTMLSFKDAAKIKSMHADRDFNQRGTEVDTKSLVETEAEKAPVATAPGGEAPKAQTERLDRRLAEPDSVAVGGMSARRSRGGGYSMRSRSAPAVPAPAIGRGVAPGNLGGNMVSTFSPSTPTSSFSTAKSLNRGAIGVEGGAGGVYVDSDSRKLFVIGDSAEPAPEGQQEDVYNNRSSERYAGTPTLPTQQFVGGGGGGRSAFQNSLQKDEAADAASIPTVGSLNGIAILEPAPVAAAAPLTLSSSGDAKTGGLTGGTGVVELKKEALNDKVDAPLVQSALPPPIPQPEEETQSNKFSTFSLNISDASYKLAAASLQNGVMPDPASIRSEEFINAFDYRDPDPPAGAPIGFAWDRAQDPFAHNRDWLRFSVKAAAQGREAGRPLNLVLLLDKSGSMERADRVAIIHEALRALASQLNARDTFSVVVFARTARLWLDGVPGSQAGDAAKGLDGLTPEGGTNLEDAMKLAYETALRHYAANGENRVVLLTDGAANLGNVDPETLKRSVKANREQGIALDCFGVGWDGYNDNLMETLSRTGNGRYGFINTPEEAGTEFAGKLAGALRVAASDVKVQVEFNPNRVKVWRQIGYAKHQLTKEQFRDNSVTAPQIGAAESGNALYAIEVNPTGDGAICTVRVRFRAPGTTDYQEHAWDVPYTGTSVALDNATPATRLAATAAAFSEWLASSPYAGGVTLDQLLGYLRGAPEAFGADARPKNLEWMIRQAKSISGK